MTLPSLLFLLQPAHSELIPWGGGRGPPSIDSVEYRLQSKHSGLLAGALLTLAATPIPIASIPLKLKMKKCS